jgi:hypothetical protein
MKGFKIQCYSEKGEECLLMDLNANKKAFNVVRVRDKPFLDIDFIFRRSSQGIMIKKMFGVVPEEEALRHFAQKLEDLGAVRGEDFEVMVL